MGFIFLALYTPILFSIARISQYVNAEQLNELQNSILKPAFVYTAGKQEGEIVAGPMLSRRQLAIGSTNRNDSSNLKLAAFNAQTFGRKKMATSGVPGILVKIILRYDVILIQEIRDSSGKAIMDLLSLVNKTISWRSYIIRSKECFIRESSRGQYGIEISPRLGRSSSKEQYGFLYRKDILSVKNSYVYDDGQESLKIDTFEREPFVVHFKSTLSNITEFVLVAIHTSPSKAPQEINELASVYDDVIGRLSITDVVILGDLNAACSYMSDRDWQKNRLANEKRFHWLISDCVDTSLAGGHCAYDRFVVAGNAMLEAVVESSAGSFEYDQVLGVNKTMASTVSDHYPIELQLYSNRMASAVENIEKSVEYAFRMKQPDSVNKWTVYRKKNTLKQLNFTETLTYRKSGGISGVTISKTFVNKKEALSSILEIKDVAQPVNMISLDQIQMAEFQMKGAWDEDETLPANGVVKLVCEIYPSPSCWITIVVN